MIYKLRFFIIFTALAGVVGFFKNMGAKPNEWALPVVIVAALVITYMTRPVAGGEK